MNDPLEIKSLNDLQNMLNNLTDARKSLFEQITAIDEEYRVLTLKLWLSFREELKNQTEQREINDA